MSKNDIEKINWGDDGCARWKVLNNTMILTATMCEDGSIVYRDVTGRVVTEEFVVSRNDHFFNP